MDDVDLSPIMVGYNADQIRNNAPVPITQPQTQPELPIEKSTKSKPEKPTQPDENSAEIKELTTRIKLYFDCFAVKLKEIKPKKPIDKLSEEELRDLQSQIHYILGAKTNVEAMAKTFPLMLKAVEELAAQFTPLRIQGTHAVCFEPDVQDMIKYSIIDMGLAGVSSTPQQRLLFTLVSTAMRQHTLNSALESMTPEQKSAYFKAVSTANTVNAPTNNAPAVKKPTKPTPLHDKFADL